MLEMYAGERACRDGIRNYTAAHASGTTTAADLWQALESAAGKPVTGIAASFTEQDGVPLIVAETACTGDVQRMTLRQDRFVIAPLRTTGAAPLPPRSWQIPVALGPLPATRPAEVVLLQGSADLAAGRCGEAIKVNLGDIGYYPLQYGPHSRAALIKSLAQMPVEDRVNFVADSWAPVHAGRAEPSTYLALIEALGPDDRRAVWDQVIGVLTGLNRLARDRAERPALQAYARARLRPVFDRLGWECSGSGDGDTTPVLARLISGLGEFRHPDVVAAS